MTNTLILLLATLMTIIILLTSLIISKSSMTKITNTPFECGFNPLISHQIPFSIQFYLTALLFLVFDIEIILILPFPLIKLNMFFTSSSIIFTLLILILGLIYEWSSKSLEWM